ncbi:MAG: hypothetical protein WA210_19620 [Burkholderiaceae bacterium]
MNRLPHASLPHDSRRTQRRLICLAILGSSVSLSLTAPALAADAASFDTAFQEFQRANTGVDAAIDTAAERFGALSVASPGDPVLLAYTGAATAMRARTTLLPWKKMSFAEDGLARIDKALGMLTPAHDAPMYRGTPASLETRFTAASTFLALPGMFNRYARGAKLLDEVLASALLASAPLPFRGAVWLRAGSEAISDKRPDDARRLLQQVVSNGAPQADKAQAKLKELSS